MKFKSDSPLRNLRRARTMNQEDLARLACITQESLSRAERGKQWLSSDVQERIAVILGASRADLFPADPETVQP